MRRMDIKAAKLDTQKEGTCFTTAELGNCPPGSKHHLSPKSYNARMECLERVRLMSPELPAVYQGHNWYRRAMAYCKRCCSSWGHSTGGKFKDEINLVVATLGIHYGGRLRVTAERSKQDTDFLQLYQLKHDHRDAFLEFVQDMRKWIPKSVTHCPT